MVDKNYLRFLDRSLKVRTYPPAGGVSTNFHGISKEKRIIGNIYLPKKVGQEWAFATIGRLLVLRRILKEEKKGVELPVFLKKILLAVWEYLMPRIPFSLPLLPSFTSPFPVPPFVVVEDRKECGNWLVFLLVGGNT